MIGLSIFNSLDEASQKSILTKSNIWLWTDQDGKLCYDGVSMLQILISKVKPTTRVGVSDLKICLRNVKLSQFNHDVSKMCEHMDGLYQEILRNKGSHEDYLMDVFNALLTTKNSIFRSSVQDEKTKWEKGGDVDVDVLIRTSVQQYNNMYKQKIWNNNDGSNAKIVALTTALEDLKAKFNTSKNSNHNDSCSHDHSKKGSYLEVAEWRKKKSFGDSVKKDGRQWYWCSIGHNKGKGMYVTHKEEDHNKRYSSKSSNSDSSNKNKEKSMTLSDNLKAAMVSKFKCSDSDADKLWNEVARKEKDFQ
jgi:hypothetical protein